MVLIAGKCDFLKILIVYYSKPKEVGILRECFTPKYSRDREVKFLAPHPTLVFESSWTVHGIQGSRGKTKDLIRSSELEFLPTLWNCHVDDRSCVGTEQILIEVLAEVSSWWAAARKLEEG